MGKQKDFANIWQAYNNSFHVIFSIISTKPKIQKLESDYKIQEFIYKHKIDENIYANWVKRHAFVDLFELTRDFFIQLVNFLESDIYFCEKKKKYFKQKKKSTKKQKFKT